MLRKQWQDYALKAKQIAKHIVTGLEQNKKGVRLIQIVYGLDMYATDALNLKYSKQRSKSSVHTYQGGRQEISTQHADGSEGLFKSNGEFQPTNNPMDIEVEEYMNNNLDENKQYKTYRNMNKKLIRLTEQDLHKIVKQSVNKILKESTYDSMGNFDKESNNNDIRERLTDEITKISQEMSRSMSIIDGIAKRAVGDEEVTNRARIVINALIDACRKMRNVTQLTDANRWDLEA